MDNATNSQKTAALTIELIEGRIEDISEGWETVIADRSRSRLRDAIAAAPVDAVSVGYYQGTVPSGSLYAIDQRISQASRRARGQEPLPQRLEKLPNSELLIRRLAERGTLTGELGYPFLLPDPRTLGAEVASRTVAILGMGPIGSFGVSEAIASIREMIWLLSQLGCRHLATVLIGAARGTMPIVKAVNVWLRAADRALRNLGPQASLKRLTFVQHNAERLAIVDLALREQVLHFEDAEAERPLFSYKPWDEADLKAIRAAADKAAKAKPKPKPKIRVDREAILLDEDDGAKYNHITIAMDETEIRFTALNEMAANPVRPVSIRKSLILEANQSLLSEVQLDGQKSQGQFLSHLVIPRDFRDDFFCSTKPLVLSLDSNSAQIRWEMLARCSQDIWSDLERERRGSPGKQEAPEEFLGILRGVTRQLQTRYAVAPLPFSAHQRAVRILIVADPCQQHRLRGAWEEGRAPEEMFRRQSEEIRRRYEVDVVVKTMIGPRDAALSSVLRELFAHPYDVLHFSGHSVYHADDPRESGLVFSHGEIFNADLLERVDRVPSFVFLNSCDSGVLSVRDEARSTEFLPYVAETFLNKGICNFIGTGWPVDDRAALAFARAFYSELLGVPEVEGQALKFPAPLWQALLAARCKIAVHEHGVRTWGSYQHYGNPIFRLFEPEALGFDFEDDLSG